MKIIDVEILNDYSMFRNKKIIIYGAGDYGKRIALFLNNIGIKPEYFVDRNEKIRSVYGQKCYTPEIIKNHNNTHEYLVVIGVNNYIEQIVNDLDSMGVDIDACTWAAVVYATEYNLNNNYFSEDIVLDYKKRKEICDYYTSLKTILNVRNRICLCNNPILVYQMGKVGSTSIFKSLQQCNIEAHHLHHLANSLNAIVNKNEIENVDEDMVYLLNRMKNNPVKIISVVRDPISRSISDYFQGITNGEMYFGKEVKKSYIEDIYDFINEQIESEYAYNWFADELKKVFSIDIFNYSFDKSKGYSIIKEQNIELLILTAEKLNKNVDVIRSFINCEEFELINDNIGSMKAYKYIYDEIKEMIKFDKDSLQEFYYNDKFVQFFYDNDYIDKLITKWTKI